MVDPPALSFDATHVAEACERRARRSIGRLSLAHQLRRGGRQVIGQLGLQASVECVLRPGASEIACCTGPFVIVMP
ncbi:MAG TPA: hypothetical protein VHD36_06965 [Pirellulales bacterium]|nr:hypothetical protein [Pirellulales bacterium]